MSSAIKFASRVKEIRIHLCQKGKGSQGVRDFIENNYVSLKSANPKFPILIRECSGVQAKVWARYENGKETSASLADIDCAAVTAKIKSIST